MKIINLLHFYQPHNQQNDILMRIVNECYRPLLNGLLAVPRRKIVANFPGVLTNLLVSRGYKDVVDAMKDLIARGQVEITSSAMYHAVLPILPSDEVLRQIEANESANLKAFGEIYKPIGFFPPELALSSNLLKMIKQRGYSWVAAPEMAYGLGFAPADRYYRDPVTGLKVFFRNKRVSILMLSALARNAETLIEETKDIHDTDKYWFTAMDAETFGHHRIGHEKMLFDVLDHEFFEPTTVGELLNDEGLTCQDVQLRPASWSNEEQDFWLDKEKTKPTESKSFILWNDPGNPIHKLQWELAVFAINVVNSYADKESDLWIKARAALDQALASDQFWWASAKPWWSLEMIEQGAYELRGVIGILFSSDTKEFKRGQQIYWQILDQAFEWQRSGYIRDKHLENSSTFMQQPFKERTPAEWYNQIVIEFEDEMLKSADKRDYEKAIKWRDALIKLKNGSDIYDVLHVVDELWSARSIPSLKPLFSRRWENYSDFAKSNFIGFLNKDDFEQAQGASLYKPN